MQKVGFFRSIHVKFVLIYIMLILVAMQIIGLYFARELEQTLKDNFTTSVRDRMNLVEFSVREEMIKDRSNTDDPSLEQSLRTVLSGFNSEDINEIRVIDAKYRILATSELGNQSLVDQRSMEDSVRRSISSETFYENINYDPASRDRVMVRVTADYEQ